MGEIERNSRRLPLFRGSCDFELPRSSSPSPCRCCWPRLPSGAFPGSNGRIAFSPGRRLQRPFRPRSFRPGHGRSPISLPGGFDERTLRQCTETEGRPPRGTCSIEYRSPAYSPNGRLIAFDAGRRLALMRSDGSRLRLLPAQTDDDGEPAFSPDGRRLVFTGHEGPANAQSAGLYVLALAGGQARQLHPNRWDPGSPGPCAAGSPSRAAPTSIPSGRAERASGG